jgi:hypothetical protein
MVLSGSVVLPIGLIRHIIDCIGSVDSHTPLDATSGHLIKGSGHILLLVQVLLALMDVAEPVDLLAGKVGGGGIQAFIIWVGSVIESQADGVNRWHLYLIIASDLFAVQIDIPMHLPQPFDVLLFCSRLLLSLLSG